ncbi:MAG: hypothetical protein ACYDBA_11565 [Sulfuricaulis sp.]
MSENTEMARHYGNMRFAMFTVFTAILGALILLPLDPKRVALVVASPQKWLLGISGIALSVGFLLAEIRISQLVTRYQEASFNNRFKKPAWHDFWKYLVPLIMILPYLGSVVFWIMFLEGYMDIKVTNC